MLLYAVASSRSVRGSALRTTFGYRWTRRRATLPHVLVDEEEDCLLKRVEISGIGKDWHGICQMAYRGGYAVTPRYEVVL
jgi:hypothetical protein